MKHLNILKSFKNISTERVYVKINKFSVCFDLSPSLNHAYLSSFGIKKSCKLHNFESSSFPETLNRYFLQ